MPVRLQSKIDGRIQHATLNTCSMYLKGEKIMGRNRVPEITENRILEMATRLFY